MPDLDVNGTRLYYQQSGSGPDVVLVHAVTSNQAVWIFSGLVDALAARFRVTSYDLRGHGASDRPRTGYTSAAMADDLHALHSALGLEPAFLVGHSFGGVTGLHTALMHSEIVRGVILSDSFFPGLKAFEPNYGKPNVWVDLRQTYHSVGVELGETIDFTRLFRATAELNAEQLAALDEQVGPFGRGWLRQLPLLAETTCGAEAFAEAGLTAEAIASVTCPVVALYDEFSPFLATSDWLEKNLVNCTAEIIPAAKHLAVLENSAGFTAAVLKHLTILTEQQNFASSEIECPR